MAGFHIRMSTAHVMRRLRTLARGEAGLPAGADGDAGDQRTVAGEGAFEVVSIEPDGQGMALLRLGALA